MHKNCTGSRILIVYIKKKKKQKTIPTFKMLFYQQYSIKKKKYISFITQLFSENFRHYMHSSINKRVLFTLFLF